MYFKCHSVEESMDERCLGQIIPVRKQVQIKDMIIKTGDLFKMNKILTFPVFLN